MDDVVKLLDKKTGKPLTDRRSKKVVTLLEENKAAGKKAYEENAE